MGDKSQNITDPSLITVLANISKGDESEARGCRRPPSSRRTARGRTRPWRRIGSQHKTSDFSSSRFDPSAVPCRGLELVEASDEDEATRLGPGGVMGWFGAVWGIYFGSALRTLMGQIVGRYLCCGSTHVASRSCNIPSNPCRKRSPGSFHLCGQRPTCYEKLMPLCNARQSFCCSCSTQ